MAWIGGALGLAGSLFGGSSAESAASTSAAAQTEAARIAADAARFRPVGVTTAFGSSNFGTDAAGNLTSAGYQLSPEMARQRDLFLQQAGSSGINMAQQAGAAGQGLFNLGQGYLAQSPEAAAQQWMQAQQAALAPGQEQELAAILNQQQQQGRGGLSVGATSAGGMAATNPQLAAYYNSLQQTNLNLAGQAQAQGRAQTAFGQGLLGSGIDLTSQGYNPYKTQLGVAQSLEAAGQGALDLGSSLGGRAAQAGANVGNTLFQGGTNAALTMQKANAYDPYAAALTAAGNSPEIVSGIKNWMNTSPVQDQGYSFGLGPSYASGYSDGGLWAPNRQGM